MAKRIVTQVSTQKIQDAAGGNRALQEVLQSVSNSVNQQQQVTSTTAKNAPPQVTATVSLLNGNYIVEIAPPGSTGAAAALESAQSAQRAAAVTGTVIPMYHQIQAATTPAFNVGSNLTIFGGDTGSAQTYWTLALASGNWYFRVRSSYDGRNWNPWKNINPGGGSVSAVTVQTLPPGVAASFNFPGAQKVALLSGLVGDGSSFALPPGLYTSAMMALAGPNGLNTAGTDAHGWDCEIDFPAVAIPAGTIGNLTPTVKMNYTDGGSNKWYGSANIFAFAFDPLGRNVKLATTAGGNWAIFTLPGGAQIAIGSGSVASGSHFGVPAGFSTSRLLAVASASNGYSSPNHAHGVNCSVSGDLVTANFQDGSGNSWAASVMWFAVAYAAGMTVDATSGFLILTLSGGSKIAFGAGNIASGASFSIPAGFSATNMLTFATPASFTDSGGYPMRGVSVCGVSGQTPRLVYSDNANNVWGGNVNWFSFLWQ